MRTFIRWLWRLLVTILLVVIVLPLAGSLLLDQEDYKSAISDWVESRTGHHLEIRGDIGIRPGLGLILFAEDIRLENADWSDHPDALRVARVEARVSIRELLRGSVVVEHALLREAGLLVERDSSGKYNLGPVGGSSAGDLRSAAAPGWLDIRSVSLEQVRMQFFLKWRNWDVQIDSATIAAEGPDTPVSVDFRGTLNTVPVTVNGTLGTIASWLQRRKSDADLTLVAAGEHALRAVGTVGDVLLWRDLDLELDGGISRLRDITPWFRFRPLDLDSVQMSGRLVQPGTIATMRLEDLTGRAGYHGIPLHASGSVGRLVSLADIQVSVRADDNWDISGLPLGDVTRLKPRIGFDAVLTGATYRLHMDVSRLAVTAAGVTVTAQGQVENASRLWGTGLPMQVTVQDIQGLGKALGRSWPASGGLNGSAVLNRDRSGFVLEDLRMQTTGELLALSGHGRIDGIGREPAGSMGISGSVKSGFFTRNEWVPALQPKVADVEAIWRLAGSRHNLAVENLLLEFPGGELRGWGDIPDLESPGALTLGLEGALWDARTFGSAHQQEWPELPELKLAGMLHGDGAGNWRIDDVEVFGEEGDESLSMTGDMALPRGRTVPRLDVKAVVSPESLAPWVREWPAGDRLVEHLAPVHAQFGVRGGAEGALSLEGLRMTSKWAGAELVVTGEVSSLNPMRGFLDVSLSGRPAALPDFSRYRLPAMEAVNLSFVMPLPWDGEVLEGFRLKARSQGGSLDLHGDISGLKPLEFDKMRLVLEYRDLAELVPAEWKLMPGNPFMMNALLGMEAGVLSADGSARLGESVIDGTASWRAPGDDGRTGLNAALRVDQLDMKTLFHPAEKTPRVFSDNPLLPAWMLQSDGTLMLEIADYWGRTTHLRDLRLDASMDGGSVESDFEAYLGDGVLSSSIRLPKGGETRVKLGVKDLPAESLRALSKGRAFTGGVIDADITLRGREQSMAGLVDRGEGQIRLNIRQSRIYGKALGTVGGDLVTNFLSAANLFDRNKDFADVECGVLYLDIGEGKAVTRNGLALKTDRVTILGGGEITFPGERIDIYLTPKAREGLGISASSIARVIQLGGTLRAPEIEADPKGLLATGLNLGAAILSGGVTLVALGLFDRFHANSDVCAIARGEQELSEIDLLEQPGSKTDRR